MKRSSAVLSFLTATSLLLSPVPAAAQLSEQSLAALRAVDLRLATIAYRLTTANAPLCRDLQPTPGWALHAVDQYDAATRPAARQVFGFAMPVAVEAVVDGGPAARAGVAPDDALVAVAGAPLAGPGESQGSATRDAALAQIAVQPADRALAVTIRHQGADRAVTIPPSPGCRSAFEVLLGPGMAAMSDGRTVQIAVRFFERYDDEQVAVIVAHELAHTILRHRVRLEAAGVKWGLFSELGRNGRLFRRTEEEADRLGAVLMRNAGYDPRAAPRFWRDHGGDVDGGLFRSRTHPSSSARAKLIQAELDAIPKDAGPVYRPPLLDSRDTPLD